MRASFVFRVSGVGLAGVAGSDSGAAADHPAGDLVKRASLGPTRASRVCSGHEKPNRITQGFVFR